MHSTAKTSIAVIGGGPMGLAIAYQLALEGCRPVLLEADDRLGGMAASFDFAGVPIERYYHFHCLSDQAFFELLEELNLSQLVRWKQTAMGFFLDGRLYPWGSAGSVLKLRRLPLLSRLRYLLHAARCLSLRDWRHLDGISATEWLRTWLGPKGYEVLWAKLFAYKFYQYTDSLSAAWIWSRIRRIGQSRRWLKETLGYLEGGSDRWIEAIEHRIRELGGEIRLSSPVTALAGDAHGARITTTSGSENSRARSMPSVSSASGENRPPAASTTTTSPVDRQASKPERINCSSTRRPSARALDGGAMAAANDCGHTSRGSPRRPAASQRIQASLRSSATEAKPLATGL